FRDAYASLAEKDEQKLFTDAGLTATIGASNALEACLRIAKDPSAAIDDLNEDLGFENVSGDVTGVPNQTTDNHNRQKKTEPSTDGMDLDDHNVTQPAVNPAEAVDHLVDRTQGVSLRENGDHDTSDDDDLDGQPALDPITVDASASQYRHDLPLPTDEALEQDVTAKLTNARHKSKWLTIELINASSPEESRSLAAQHEDNEKIVSALEAYLKRLTKAASTTDASATLADPTTLRIDRSYPRFKEGDQPVGFLTKLQRRVTNKESESYLANNIYRLLGNLVDDEDAIAQFEAEIRSRKQNALAAGVPFPDPPNWDVCASAFIKVTLSDAGRRDQVARLVHDGRRANETWVEFARRLRTEMRLYSMNDSEADYFVPALQEKVTEVINNMLTNFGVSAGHRVRHFATFNDFVEELSAMHGPANVKKRSADGDSPRPAKARSLARSGANMGTQLSPAPASSSQRPACSICGRANHSAENCFA
ncbi:hypothetical protein DFQ26_000698, partial [Actinomortierella ambigua]